jgi:hypothetical protein
VVLAATINCDANHCQSGDPSFYKGSTVPWLHIYLLLGNLLSYTITFPLQIGQEYVNFRPRNSGSIPDRDKGFHFLQSFHVGTGNHPGRGGIIWPVCNNDHSALFIAHMP